MNVDKDLCPRYHLHLACDLARARACLGAHSVLSTEEYAKRHRNKPLVVRHVHCWNGPLGVCERKWPKALYGKNCLGTAVVRDGQRMRFTTRPVKGMPRWTRVRWPKGKEAWRLQLLNEDGRVAVKERAEVRFACLPRFSNLSQVMEAYGEVKDKVLVVGDLVGTAVSDLWPASQWLVQALGGGGEVGERVVGQQAVVDNRPNGSFESSQEDSALSGNASSILSNNSNGSITITNETFSKAATRFLAGQSAGYTNPLLGTLEDWTSMLAPLSPLYPSAPIAPHALVVARAQAVISFLFGAAQGDEGHRQLVRTLLTNKNYAAFWQQVSNHSDTGGNSNSSSSSTSSSSSSDVSSNGSSSVQGTRFLAVHWRRGDWWMYCAVAGPPGACNFASPQAAYCVVKVARKHNLTNIFLATNAKQSEVCGSPNWADGIENHPGCFWCSKDLILQPRISSPAIGTLTGRMCSFGWYGLCVITRPSTHCRSSKLLLSLLLYPTMEACRRCTLHCNAVMSGVVPILLRTSVPYLLHRWSASRTHWAPPTRLLACPPSCQLARTLCFMAFHPTSAQRWLACLGCCWTRSLLHMLLFFYAHEAPLSPRMCCACA